MANRERKNLIYMVSINHPTSVYKNTDYSQYSIKTWEYWCKKNDVDFIVIDKHDERFGRPIWNKELIFEYGHQYEKIGVIKWIYDSINVYKKFFPDTDIDLNSYFNAGVLFFGHKYLPVFEDVLNFYLANQKELDNWKLGGGKEQTILNYHLVKHNVKKKELTPNWNLLGMHRRDLFSHNWQLKDDLEPFFIKYGNIWHFTGFPIEDRIRIMGQVWDAFGGNYE